MLFRRDIEPQCSYCLYGVTLGNGAVGCTKCGVISEYGSCRKFTYDPYSRIPELPWSIRSTDMASGRLNLVLSDFDTDTAI